MSRMAWADAGHLLRSGQAVRTFLLGFGGKDGVLSRAPPGEALSGEQAPASSGAASVSRGVRRRTRDHSESSSQQARDRDGPAGRSSRPPSSVATRRGPAKGYASPAR